MDRRVLIFGNSGSGKSTLAKRLASSDGLAHLDLDSLAWQPYEPPKPPQRMPLNESEHSLRTFIQDNQNWVIEGCYTDLLQLLVGNVTELIFMNLPVDLCIENAKQRPWEPHKYPSKQAQDANLSMLIEWIAQYDLRDDTFSRRAHEDFYSAFQSKKTCYLSNLTFTGNNRDM
ncbi:AAA family ATPase [Shewanella psychropiezotolerans]|uniref:AAA family ATPase n=1 Tax=Shewanella psychropiezotolerans TaxID=2593655 RepID=A0ABX5WVB0_9GAMM|nr:AAA family ATPase [Shewanella psychropiezotolerans]QDO82741.1 AAA family ATPase [Shewanella psychropiezotolerans]